MRLFCVLSVAALAGCAAPIPADQVSNFDLCRYTMGGPYARSAEVEAARRGLDCRPYYPAIQQQRANQNAATQQFIQSLQPPRAPAPRPPVSCTSYRVGNTVQTDCQ